MQRRLKLLLISVALLSACSEDQERTLLNSTTKDVIEKSVKANAICKALSRDEVEEISGSALVSLETIAAESHWCRYTLKNGDWFSISSSPWYKAVDIPLDCYDEQNDPDAYKKVYRPFCMTILGDKRLEIVSSQHRGISKNIMKSLLKSAAPRLVNN